MAAAGPSTMEVDSSQYRSITSTSIILDEFHNRSNFVNKERLRKQYCCGICSQILLQPYQTPCGNRVCKRCIDDKFGTESVITCPLSHDDLDADELAEEICQQEGLVRDQVIADPGSQRILLKEKCFCANKPYGCCDTPMWKKLKDHQVVCQYVPQQCPNTGCIEKFAKQDIPAHVSRCDFTIGRCQFCKQLLKKGHLEVIAEIAMDVRKLTDKLNASETNGDHLVNEMRTVAHSSQQIKSGQTTVDVIERQIKDSGLDRVTVIESHSQNIRRHNRLLDKMERQRKNHGLFCYDGALIWKIGDYTRRRDVGILGRHMSTNRCPYYTTKFGYKIGRRGRGGRSRTCLGQEYGLIFMDRNLHVGPREVENRDVVNRDEFEDMAFSVLEIQTRQTVLDGQRDSQTEGERGAREGEDIPNIDREHVGRQAGAGHVPEDIIVAPVEADDT